MIVINAHSGIIDYRRIVNQVVQRGVRRAPRDKLTYDLGPTTIVYGSPYDAMPLGIGRKLNPAIGAAEALQLIAGSARHDLMPRISPNFSAFLEEDDKFWGSYGDRIGSQVMYAVNKLTKDRDTRQAVITLWRPALDNTSGKRDYPCTVALNYAIVNDRLEARTVMRSNDAWWGLPYDVFQFTQLQLTMARALGVQPGRYTHTAWSLHIYDEHVPFIDDLTEPGDLPYQPTGFGFDGMSWLEIQTRAYRLLHSPHHPLLERTESEMWYESTLASYLG